MRTFREGPDGDSLLSRIRIWHVILLALILRVIWSLCVPIHPVSDAVAYDELASQIANGLGYRWVGGNYTAYWPVGTSALYGAVYSVFGREFLVVAMLNAILGSAIVGLTFALARTRFDRRVALLSAVLVAIWPTWIVFTTIIASELATNVLFLAGIVCALRRAWPFLPRVAGATILLALATYFRSNVLPFVVIVPVLAAIVEGRYRRILPGVAIALIVTAIMLAPWAARNARLLGAAVPTSTNFGINLWIGNNPHADGGFMEPPSPGPTPPPADEVARDRYYKDHAVDFIRQNPGRYVLLCLQRIPLTFDREIFGILWNDGGLAPAAKTPLKIVSTGYWYVIFLLGLVGAVTFVRRDPKALLSPLILLPCAVVATPVLIMATERYHYSVAPFLAVFAAYLLLRWRNPGVPVAGAPSNLEDAPAR